MVDTWGLSLGRIKNFVNLTTVFLCQKVLNL